MAEYVRVRNWEKYQHYKDRRPPWIKLHADLLDDRELVQLGLDHIGMFALLLILASRSGNYIKLEDVPWSVRIDERIISPIIAGLMSAGFIEPAAVPDTLPAPGWGNRYVSKQLREAIFTRDHGACQSCGRTEHLEIDHIIPVSQGGQSSPDNLQVLCRSCNRRKRAKLINAERKSATQRNRQATQLTRIAATEAEAEAEAETETETEKTHTVCSNDPQNTPDESQAASALDLTADNGGRRVSFDEFWKAYPRKTGKQRARKAWARIKPKTDMLNLMLSAIERQQKTEQWKRGIIPHPATWLNGARWEDEIPDNGDRREWFPVDAIPED